MVTPSPYSTGQVSVDRDTEMMVQRGDCKTRTFLCSRGMYYCAGVCKKVWGTMVVGRSIHCLEIIMSTNMVKRALLRQYKAYLSLKRSICDYFGSLRVNNYSNSSQIIRTFMDDDLEKVLDIYEKSFGNKNYNQIIKYSKQFRNIFYVYEVDGIIVGYLGFYVNHKYEGLKIVQKATAFSGAVDENMRGKGIFTTIYRECLSELKKNGVRVVYGYINVNNASSLAVHHKFGFKIVGRIENYYGLDDAYKVEIELHDYHPRISVPKKGKIPPSSLLRDNEQGMN